MFDDAFPAFDACIYCHFAETFLVQTRTHSESGRLRAKKDRRYLIHPKGRKRHDCFVPVHHQRDRRIH
jgi:hypothetical protein